MAIQDTFIGNLRAARNIASGMASPAPADTKATADKSNPFYGPNIDKPRNPTGRMPTREFNTQPGEAQRKMADSGTKFLWKSRIGEISSDQYRNFVNGRQQFSEMMSLWSDEDDPNKRIDIVHDYATRNRFMENKIFADLLDSLGQYDNGNINDKNAPADSFTRKMRKEWQKAFEENMNAAQDIYNPERRRLWT